MKRTITAVIVLSCVWVVTDFIIGEAAKAATITLNAIDSGWVRETGEPSGLDNQNYIAGVLSGVGFDETRNWFVFDLSGITLPIVSAYLRAYNPSELISGDTGNGFRSGIPSVGMETYSIFSYESEISLLTGNVGGLSVFDDLGSGANYGSRVVSNADNGTIVSITLTADALDDLNAASALFAIGGAVTTLDPGGDQHIFAHTMSATVSDTTRQLVLETIPVPAAVWLLGSALGLLGWMRYK